MMRITSVVAVVFDGLGIATMGDERQPGRALPRKPLNRPHARFCAFSEDGAGLLFVTTQMAHYVGVRFVNIVAPVEERQIAGCDHATFD